MTQMREMDNDLRTTLMTTMIPTKKMIVEARHLPKIGTVRKKTDVGITCLSQAPDDQSLVVFGTESGAILEGTLTTPTVIHGPNMNHIPGKNYLEV